LKNKIVYPTLIIFLILLTTLSVSAQEYNRAPRININGITGDDFIGQAGVLYPFKNTEDSLWFGDLRYRMSEDDVEEWNIGLGYRYKLDSVDNKIGGIYLYKDRREEYEHYWNMWTVGGEILTDQWDFRMNGYIADNDRVLAPGAVAGGSSIKVNNNRELVLVLGNEVYYTAMDGLDLEMGKRFTETDSIFKNVGIYAKLYRFFESDTPTITGRQIRIDKQFGDINKTTWKIGAKWMDDNVRGSETEATFAISIPFGKGIVDDKRKEFSPSEILEARMIEQPERDLDVVVGKSVSENVASGEEVIIQNPVLEESLKVWYVTENGDYGGEGSKNDPINIHSLIDGVTDIKPGDLIILCGRDGDILLDSNELTLEDSQQIISKRGYALVEADIKGELKEYIFKPDVEQATLVGAPSSGRGMISPGKDNVISGINLTNESTIPFTIYPHEKGYLNINNNKFYFTAENIDEGYGIHAVLSESFDIWEISIVDNKFYNYSNSTDQIFAISIQNYNKEDKITIIGNEISGFKSTNNTFINNPEWNSAIQLTQIFTSDTDDDYFINIEDNYIIDYNYGIVFKNYDSENVSLSIEDYYQTKNIFESTVEVDDVKIIENY